MAAESERPNLPWAFHLLDDETVNAFALPGGFIFITRGIMTYMNDEAELASVIGHEIGHVTAKHSVSQMSKAQLAQVGLVAGMIASPTVRDMGAQLQQGMQLLFLKFGRDDETEADLLGFRYMMKDGYDVRAAGDMFRTLDRISGSAGQRLPEWAVDAPGSRQPGEACGAARRLGAAGGAQHERRDAGTRVVHEAARRVRLRRRSQAGLLQERGVLPSRPEVRGDVPGGLADAEQARGRDGGFAAADGGGAAAPGGQGYVGGHGREARSSTQEGDQPPATRATRRSTACRRAPATSRPSSMTARVIQGSAAFIEYGEYTYMIMGYTLPDRTQNLQAIRQVTRTFKPLTDPAYLNVQAARLNMVKVPTRDDAGAVQPAVPVVDPHGRSWRRSTGSTGRARRCGRVSWRSRWSGV